MNLICSKAVIARNLYGKRIQINAGTEVEDYEVAGKRVALHIKGIGYIFVELNEFKNNFGIPVKKKKQKEITIVKESLAIGEVPIYLGR